MTLTNPACFAVVLWLVCAAKAVAAPPALVAASTEKPLPSITTTAQATQPASGYLGLGADSVAPAVLAKHRAPPLPSSVTRRVQAMLDVRSPAAGVLSPDGKQLFFTWAVTGVRQVWRLSGPNTFPRQMTGGEDATSVVAVTRDGTQLVVARDQKGEENPGLYLQSVAGGPLHIVQHKPKIQTQAQHLSTDGRFLYFRSNDESADSYVIYRYVFETKKIERVFGQTGLWSIASRKIDQTHPQGLLLLTREVGSNQNEIFQYDEGTKELTPLFGQGEREDYVATWGSGDEILVLTPHFSEFRRLFVFNPQDKVFTPVPVAQGTWDVAFSINEARTRITLTSNEGGYTRPFVLDARTKKTIKTPYFPRSDLFSWGATTADSRYTSLSLDSGVSPSASYVLDWKTGALVAWHTPSAPEVDLESFVPVSLEDYPARDGTKIPLFVRRPPACAAALVPCPVIVDFHGGPEAQTLAGFSTRAQLFVDAGFAYVQPNVRGSDGYGKAWVHADDGVKRRDVVTDIQDAALFIKAAWAKGGVSPRVGVMGGSYGGYATLMAMTMFAGSFDAGVEIVGISNLITFLTNTAPYRRALRVSEYGDPDKDRDALLALSPTTWVDKIRGPLLLIQGATDPRVPVGEALQMFEVIDKKNVGAKMIIFPDEGHGVQKRENAVLMLGHSLAFFETWLKTPAPPAVLP